MSTIKIEMSEYQAEEILNEAKNQIAEIGFTLANHHLQYQGGARNHDIDTTEVREAVKRLDTVGGLMGMLEDARQKAREAKNEK